jgi:23S rRNA pseudouridine1911/1915/1917 synthase
MRLTVGPEGAGRRLDRFLAARFPELSRALVMKYLKEGRARLNGAPARPGLFLKRNDEVDLPEFEEAIGRIRGGRPAGMPDLPRPTRPQEVEVLYEDDYLVVVDKPPGLVMHPGKGHEEEGLDLILREHYGPSTRLVHRIDRDTSGVVVAARGHPEAARRLASAFKEGDIEKAYLGLVRGRPEPPAGRIDEPLLDTREEGSRVHVDPHGKPAETAFETLEDFATGYAWLRIRPATGRRHQIRAHLAWLGHPLAVDAVYARRKRLRLRDLRPDLEVTWKNPVVLGRQPLHASELTLRHPESGEDVTFRAPVPQDLESVLELLRASGAS